MGARLGEGWKRKLKRHYGYVRVNKWAEDEEGRRTMIKLHMKDKGRQIDNDIEKWEKTVCVCVCVCVWVWVCMCVCVCVMMRTEFVYTAICLHRANHIQQPSLEEMLWCRVVYVSHCMRYSVWSQNINLMYYGLFGVQPAVTLRISES